MSMFLDKCILKVLVILNSKWVIRAFCVQWDKLTYHFHFICSPWKNLVM